MCLAPYRFKTLWGLNESNEPETELKKSRPIGGRTLKCGGEGGDRDLEFAVSKIDRMPEQVKRAVSGAGKGLATEG